MSSKENFLQSVLYPAVRVRAKKGTGSGTIIWSGKVGDIYETYILTNNHVIASSVTLKEKYDSFVGQNMPAEVRSTVAVDLFRYPKGSKLEGILTQEADIVAYNAAYDLALLQLRTEFEADNVATLPTEALLKELTLGEEVCAVGAALGRAPIMTHGRINGMSDELDDKPYWLSDAQIIFGNSGGAVYHIDSLSFLGVPSQVSLTQMGWSVVPVSHIGWFIPFCSVQEFLTINYYQFIFDGEEDAADCHEARVEAQDQMSRMADLVMMKARSTHKDVQQTNKYYKN